MRVQTRVGQSSQTNGLPPPRTPVLRSNAPTSALRPAPRSLQPATYLSDAEVAALVGPLKGNLPAEIATHLEVPRVDTKWYLRERGGSIVTLPGDSALLTGKSPWLLCSPIKFTEAIPEELRWSFENVPTDQPWRLGYYPVIADNTRSLGAFVAQLPPDFDPKNPAKTVRRIVMVIGSGDNHARAIISDFGGFSAPGTLLVAFDMKLMSVGMNTPDSPGHAALVQGLAHVRKTLGLPASIPEYVAGFSAGGAGALVQAFQDFPEIKAAAALSPVIQEWNVHADPSSVPGTIPATDADEFAKTSARGTAFTQTLTYAGKVARSYFTAEEFARLSPQHRLAQGEMPRIPLLVTGGTEDELAQPVIRSTVELASFNKGATLPLVFGPQDDQDGKAINIEGFADVLAKRPGLAAITLQGLKHRTHAELRRPDGKSWMIDTRALMMRFFLELERVAKPSRA